MLFLCHVRVLSDYFLWSCLKVEKLFVRNKHSFWNYWNSLRAFVPWSQSIKLWTNFSPEIIGIPTITLKSNRSHLQLLKLQIKHMCVWYSEPLHYRSSFYFNARLNYQNCLTYRLCRFAVISQKICWGLRRHSSILLPQNDQTLLRLVCTCSILVTLLSSLYQTLINYINTSTSHKNRFHVFLIL